eukprot:TRINITY_DN454_c0_g1_i1.p1 TRINITY_DN454_c0_g1~~TRINITY_DN454_c0_g1_i1.p1  ORF type:complete len:1487 (+),score=235.64 TRINITY_DN454_c0_g1_i1:2224-6684(+)
MFRGVRGIHSLACSLFYGCMDSLNSHLKFPELLIQNFHLYYFVLHSVLCTQYIMYYQINLVQIFARIPFGSDYEIQIAAREFLSINPVFHKYYIQCLKKKKTSKRSTRRRPSWSRSFFALTHTQEALKASNNISGYTRSLRNRLSIRKSNTFPDSSKYSVRSSHLSLLDEILVNASDNYQRDRSMNLIKVEINQEENKISIHNNGKGIPCVIHKEHNMYVPELIFGHLLTSSNYDDTQKKVTGGRNGYGAKLTNIFSRKFIVEAADGKNKKIFRQVYTDNMSNKTAPEIKKYKGEDYTCITFYPDLERFSMSKLEDDIASLMIKRVYDVAGITPDGVKVVLNGEQLKVKSFYSYVDYYLNVLKKKVELDDEPQKIPKIFERPNDRWEVCVSVSDGQFQQVSFVNGICTAKGGTHVNYVTDQIVEAIQEYITKKHKLQLKPHQVKSYLWVFVNCMIENPTFDSQTKETLTLKPSAFGSECKLSDSFIKKVLDCGVIETLVSVAQAREKASMVKQLKGRKTGRLLGIEKLEDANFAGTKKSENCVLIVTEGDSAKGLAMDGLEVVGRDYFGVFPLRGKMLNVRDAKASSIKENREIQDIIKILGLQIGKTYDDIKSLRYGGLMIMADQDHDGSHIKGLVINFFHAFWPSLFERGNFLMQFITPIIKAIKGKEIKQFFTLPEYEAWALNRNLKGYKIKYYKVCQKRGDNTQKQGLGTSTPAEAKEYFRNIEKHQLCFEYVDDEDDDAFVMAFGKKNAEKRKDWLNTYEEGTGINYNQKTIRYKEFVNKELILFSMYDNMRSIPSVCDGFKPAQRKILYCCFKRNLVSEIKVAQLSGYVSEHSSYHHGEQSLAQTIVGMAQNFVGSNNINLLLPIGQFGSRHMGGKEAASARYIFTAMSKLTRYIFRPEDDPLMRYQIEEGQKIEPVWYLPIIPMILVNGSDGIGTGWRTTIPNYNPREIVENIKRKLRGEPFKKMVPWFKNHKGEIIPNESKKDRGYTCYGMIETKDDNTVVIKELPVRKWTRDYKNFLEEMIEGAVKEKETKKSKKEGKKEGKKGKRGRDGKVKKRRAKKEEEEKEEGTKSKAKKRGKKSKEFNIVVEDIKEYHSGHDIHFEVKVKKEGLADVIKSDKDNALIRAFKLTTSIPLTQFVCFDHNNKLKKYKDELSIMEEFYEIRLQMYYKRKEYMLREINRELSIIENKVRFILGVIDDKIVVKKQKRKALVTKLYDLKFVPYSKFGSAKEQSLEEKILVVSGQAGGEGPEESKNLEEDDDRGMPVPAKEYDYLLKMPLWSLTYEKVEELLAEKNKKKEMLDSLAKKTEAELWEEDLDNFLKVLDEVEKEEQKEQLNEKGAAPVSGLSKTRARRKPAKKTAKKENESGKKKEEKKTRRGGRKKKGQAESNQGILEKFIQSKPQSQIEEGTIERDDLEDTEKRRMFEESTMKSIISDNRTAMSEVSDFDALYDDSESDEDGYSSNSESDQLIKQVLTVSI